MTSANDDKVRQIAENIASSIHRYNNMHHFGNFSVIIGNNYYRDGNGSLSMQLVGKDFHVRFFRHKRQQIYQWKGKEKEKLILYL